MATTNNSISSDKKNEKYEVCPVCNKGIFLPQYPEKEKNVCFICNNCGAVKTIDPANVIVE